MFVTRKLTPKVLIGWLGKHILLLLAFNTAVAVLYHCFKLQISLPWLPVSVIGTAVAFFVGFKNNQAYDRMWEARKNWGGIVNDSRAWGMRINSFLNISNFSDDNLMTIKKRLVYRHIAWLYAHRSQLLQPTSWEQEGATGLTGKQANIYNRNFGLGKISNDVTKDDLSNFISSDELERMKGYKNMATQLISEQSKEIKELLDKKLISELLHLQLEELLRAFYEHQGKNERIKKFPFPRDYSSMSHLFVAIFVFLFPFSLIPELMQLGQWAFWLSIPVASLIGLVYIIMEDLGDYTENPFMGTPHAMPMLSICRTIEIDLREMLGETDLPKSIEPVDSVLM